MYQNLPMEGDYSFAYGNQSARRMNPLDRSQQQMMRYDVPPRINNQFSSGGYLKGRPVVSIEEARAAQIDLDGSLFIFTDIGNHKIYTKQINMDGTASLLTYSLTDNPEPNQNFVTKEELNIMFQEFERRIGDKERKVLNEQSKF